VRILAVDPGEKRIGLALSDPSGTIANPLTVLKHVSRTVDAATIAQLALEHEAERIIVGQALDDDNQPTPQSRRAYRLAAAIRSQTRTPVELWDESGSTQAAQAARIAMGVSRRKRGGHMDDIAATYILQTYLDARDRLARGQSDATPLAEEAGNY
jgi:putative holliday junction resolvase